jgi:hypothetical protein
VKNDHAADHVSDRLGGHLEGDLSLAEFARVDAHLAVCAECAAELRELRTTVALLRGLPDPAPPAELAEAVMRRIDSGEGRPPRLVPLFRRVAEPRLAAALAAGVMGLLLFNFTDFGSRNFLGSSSESSPDRTAMSSDAVRIAAVRAVEARRPLPPRRAPAMSTTAASVGRSHPLVAFSGVTPPRRPSPTGSAQGFGFFGSAAPESPLRDLDGELEALMADPAAFLDRFRRTAEASRRPMVAPLVEHSARRGDAGAVARLAGIAAQPQAVPASAR